MGDTTKKAAADKIDVLTAELKTLKGLIETEKDAEVREELKTERIKVVAELNRELGYNIQTINN